MHGCARSSRTSDCCDPFSKDARVSRSAIHRRCGQRGQALPMVAADRDRRCPPASSRPRRADAHRLALHRALHLRRRRPGHGASASTHPRLHRPRHRCDVPARRRDAVRVGPLGALRLRQRRRLARLLGDDVRPRLRVDRAGEENRPPPRQVAWREHARTGVRGGAVGIWCSRPSCRRTPPGAVGPSIRSS